MQQDASYLKHNKVCFKPANVAPINKPAQSSHHHGLHYGKVGEEAVILHDIARHLAETAGVTRPAVDKYLPFHTTVSAI